MRPNPGPVQPPVSGTANKLIWPHHLILTLTFAAAAGTLFHPAGTVNGLDALLLLLATAASISALARRLPLQSILFAAFIAALVGGAAHGLSAKTGIPFGPIDIWPEHRAEIIQHRSVDRGITLDRRHFQFTRRGAIDPAAVAPDEELWLHGHRPDDRAGAGFDLALEPFASVKRFWLWQPTKILVTWQGASPLSFIGWMFVTLIILAFVTPFLIRKQPGEQYGPDFSPLALWLGTIALFAMNSARAGLWPAVFLDAAIVMVVALFSWRGAKW